MPEQIPFVGDVVAELERRLRNLPVSEREWRRYLDRYAGAPYPSVPSEETPFQVDEDSGLLRGRQSFQTPSAQRGDQLPYVVAIPITVPEDARPSTRVAYGPLPQDLDLRNGPDADDIQGNILAGFRKDYHALLFLDFQSNRARARTALTRLIPYVSTTREVADFNERYSEIRRVRQVNRPAAGELPGPRELSACWVNLSLTYRGLAIFLSEAEQKELDRFEAFAQGAANASRAKLLGDRDESDPKNWRYGKSGQSVDALLIVEADDEDDLQARVEELRQILTSPEANVAILDNEVLRGSLKYQTDLTDPAGTYRPERLGMQSFGFNENISQPKVKGFDPSDPSRPGEDRVEVKPGGDPTNNWGGELVPPGEFVLGKDRVDRADLRLPDWMKNGSFHVFRHYTLNEQRAREFLDLIIERFGIDSLDGRPDYEFAIAKLVGRWRDGTPLEKAPRRRDKTMKEATNDFNYNDDLDGVRTPQFAHIRKMNPRAERPYVRHRIIRRSVPFRAEERASDAPAREPAKVSEGLLFHAYMASIDGQFEHLLQMRANQSRFPEGFAPGPDAVIGRAPLEEDNRLQLQLGNDAEGKPQLGYEPLMRLFKTTGAVYAFAPSLTALRKFAGEQP